MAGTPHIDRISYVSLGEVLERAGVVPGAAELHGCVCGLLCSGGGDSGERWLEECVAGCDARGEDERKVRAVLRSVGLQAWRMLASGDMSFEPLLPDDEQPLAERVHALAQWCQGFLAGLGLGGLDPAVLDAAGPESITEIFADFAEISRAALDAGQADDPDAPHFAFEEVKEYVRVSVQILFEELATVRGEQDRRILH